MPMDGSPLQWSCQPLLLPDTTASSQDSTGSGRDPHVMESGWLGLTSCFLTESQDLHVAPWSEASLLATSFWAPPLCCMDLARPQELHVSYRVPHLKEAGRLHPTPCLRV